VERIFSGGRDTIGLRRASLKAETIQMLMLVKARLRMARNTVIDLTTRTTVNHTSFSIDLNFFAIFPVISTRNYAVNG
jgi:hypothetical protein